MKKETKIDDHAHNQARRSYTSKTIQEPPKRGKKSRKKKAGSIKKSGQAQRKKTRDARKIRLRKGKTTT